MSVTPASQPPASALPRVLLQAKLLTTQQVESITRSSTSEKIPFIDALIKSGAMQPVALAQFCSQTFGHPLLDLTALDTHSLPEKVIDDRLMQTQRVVVLAKRANKVCIAIADPTQTQALDQVKFQTGLSVDPVGCGHKPIAASHRVARCRVYLRFSCGDYARHSPQGQDNHRNFCGFKGFYAPRFVGCH